jgi:hypothetical protein
VDPPVVAARVRACGPPLAPPKVLAVVMSWALVRECCSCKHRREALHRARGRERDVN